MDDGKALNLTGALPQNVNYAIKSALLLSLGDSVPELSRALKRPNQSKRRELQDAVKDVQESTALVLVYH
jgi:hypothetical protein